MTTALQIINRATILNGGRAVGETLEAGPLDECFQALNSLIDTWGTTPQAAFNNEEVVVTMPPGTTSMTIGPSQQIDVPRPLRIEMAYARYSNIDRVIDVIEDKAVWDQILIKDLGTSWPEVLWYDGGLPTGNVYFWPKPSGTVTLHLTVLNYLAQYSGVNQDQNLSRGYKRALEFGLAVETAPLFNLEPSPSLARNAALAYRNLRRANSVVPEMEIGERRSSRLGRFLAGL